MIDLKLKTDSNGPWAILTWQRIGCLTFKRCSIGLKEISWAFLLWMASQGAWADEQSANWSQTVSRVAESVVSLQLSQLRAFDGISQGNSNATGFVVDAERGIILTNRHVVGSGPIRVSATFQNQERIDAVPLYRDPIHDFAFLQYAPSDLQYASPDSLPLRPDKARTGLNIRVIGSDGGEQLSILPGTIARMDREVPSYGRYGYNDFNTFYMQAASGTSGGSSGSPVIDADGHVVALNAAANTRTASSFFLPLPRIVYALERLQANRTIDRGSLQTLFSYQPYRQLQRLGLDKETEAEVRVAYPGGRGMLVVSQIIPGGVADQQLESGDIVTRVDGELVTDFIGLAQILDQSVGETLKLEIIRQGQSRALELVVADLHALAPSRLLELGDTILQDMSIQHARAMNREQRGVVVMQPGYSLTRASVPRGALIIGLEDQPIHSIDDFVEQLQATQNVAKKRIRFVVPRREFTTELSQFQVNNRWFGHRLCSRVDAVRFWDCEAVRIDSVHWQADTGEVMRPSFSDSLLERVAPSLVKVDFSVPYPVDNVYARHFNGVGLIVDADQGLVAVDRNTVPVALGDARLTFFGALQIPAEVVFLHPRHNLALLQFDVTALNGTQLQALELVDETPWAESLSMIGYRIDGTFRKHRVDDLSPVTINFSPPGLPRFQQASLDVYDLRDTPPSLGGPLVDSDGRVYAFFMSFAFENGREVHQREYAMPASVIASALELYRLGQAYRSFDARLAYRPLYIARQLGLPDDWLRRFNALPAEDRHILYIEQLIPNTHAHEVLLSGDILLAIDGQLVSNLLGAEHLSQRDALQLTILRSGEVLDIELNPSSIDGRGTQRLVSWAGAYFQDSFVDIGYQKGVHFPGVYIADTEEGSPALWDRLYRNRFVVAVDGEPVDNLNDFIKLVSQQDQDEITRLTVIGMNGRKRIVTVQPEYHFWPTFEVRRDNRHWSRIDYPMN